MDRDLARDVGKQIDARLGPLRDELARTTRVLGKVTATVADLERRLARAEQRLVDEARARQEAEQAHRQEIGHLHGEHAALSRVRAVQASTPVAGLDERDDGLDDLAAAARRGADLLARRLSDGERTHLATLADTWSTWERARLARRMRAMMLSRKLADGALDDPERRAVAEAFRAVERELAGLDERRDATRSAAEDATRRLTEDGALRRDPDADVQAGEDADRRIRAIARERIVDAVARGDLMPPWFESVLRARPLGDDPQWLQAASSLVAYRILYGVDDPESAFGPDPTEDWPRARRLWRLGLQQSLHGPTLRPAGTPGAAR